MDFTQPPSTPKSAGSDPSSSPTSQVPFELPTPPPIIAPKRSDEDELESSPPRFDLSMSTIASGSPAPADANPTSGNVDLTRFCLNPKVYRLSFLDQSNDVLAISTSTPKSAKIGDMFKQKRGVIITRTQKMLEGGEREVLSEKEKDELWVMIVGNRMEDQILSGGDFDVTVKDSQVMETTEIEGGGDELDEQTDVRREAQPMDEDSLSSEYSQEEMDRKEISLIPNVPSPSRLVQQEISADTLAHLAPGHMIDGHQFPLPGASLPASPAPSFMNEYPSVSEKPSTIGAYSAMDDYFSIRVAQRRHIPNHLGVAAIKSSSSPSTDVESQRLPPGREEPVSKLPMNLFWLGFALPLAWIAGGWFCPAARTTPTTSLPDPIINADPDEGATAVNAFPSLFHARPLTPISDLRSPQSLMDAHLPSTPATVRAINNEADYTASSSKLSQRMKWLGHQDKWVLACRRAILVFVFLACLAGVVMPVALKAAG
ncbi:hypothetical protein IAR50_005031 [Cryptococcus sp. DSM 104548]